MAPTVTPALDRLAAVYRGRNDAIRAAASARVIGYSCETVPVELIHAAGCIAYRLSGDPHIGNAMQEQFVYPLSPKSMSASRARTPDFVTSICSQALAGHYDFVDHLVFSNTRKSFLMLPIQLRDAEKHFPDLRIPATYVVDRAQTPFTSSRIFNRDRIVAFREALEHWVGTRIDDEALSDAISRQNEVRALLRRVKDLRNADRPLLSGVEALWFYGASRFLPIGDLLSLAYPALEEAAARPGRTGPRLFVSGSPIDQDSLYSMLEMDGATIVADNHSWGDGLAEPDVDIQRSPLAALVDHYEMMAPLIYPLSASVMRTVDMARAARADAAILHVYEGDEIKLWEAPGEQAALTDAGIPSIYFAEQPYQPSDLHSLNARLKVFLQDMPGQLNG